MKARLDTSLESWGEFWDVTSKSGPIRGRLSYDPVKGIELELVENPYSSDPSALNATEGAAVLHGRLVDGTLLTLAGCFIIKTSLGAGSVGLPTKLRVSRALFGGQFADIEQTHLSRYSVEFSSLANWTGSSPVTRKDASSDGAAGFDITCRKPAKILVELPKQNFDLEISHCLTSGWKGRDFNIQSSAGVTIVARESMTLEDADEISWQCNSLMSLLIGDKLSVKSISVKPVAAKLDDKASYNLLYVQRGKHNHPDLHVAEMLVPYGSIKDDFPLIVRTWFDRPKQAVIASNVFFGSQHFESQSLEVKFLFAIYSAEAYQRSLGTGMYMDQEQYDKAIETLVVHMPTLIEGDHRQSLKNRLRYGNEYSLRKRLSEMLTRLPDDVRSRIAENVGKFVSRVADTRNYFTHYGEDSLPNAFTGKYVLFAAEKVRVLVIANLLLDLGLGPEKLSAILKRSPEIDHWLSQKLPD